MENFIHNILARSQSNNLAKKKFQNELEVLENIFHPINDYSKV